MPTRLPRHPELRDRIVSVTVIESDERTMTVLPSSGAVLGIQHRGRVRAGSELLSVAGVTGIQPVAREYTYLGSTTTVLVRFTPQGASCLGLPAAELSAQSVSLAELLPPAAARQFAEQIIEAPDVARCVGKIEELLLALPFARDPLVERAIAFLSEGSIEASAVASVARALSISERQLQRRFLERVGVTPKRFARLRRFERAVALAQTSESLTQVAFDAGYCDQSHFIRDFRHFTGRPPSVWLGERVSDLSNRAPV